MRRYTGQKCPHEVNKSPSTAATLQSGWASWRSAGGAKGVLASQCDRMGKALQTGEMQEGWDMKHSSNDCPSSAPLSVCLLRGLSNTRLVYRQKDRGSWSWEVDSLIVLRLQETVLCPGRPSRALGEGSWKAPGRPVRRVGRGKTSDCCGIARLSCHSWSPPLSPCVTEERSHNLDKGRFVWQPQRGEGESGRGGPGQERVTPPLWLALPPPLALGRKHLCPTDTHILC